MTANEVVGLVLGVLGIVSILLGALGWWIKQRIREFTYSIQPSANGGRSLNDLHVKIDGLCEDIRILKRAVVQLEDDIEELR